MNKFRAYYALAIGMIVGGGWCVPVHGQSLQSLYDLADQQSQKLRVSEVALKAAEEGVAVAKSAMLPSVELSLTGSYTGNAMMLSRGFSTSGTTDYIVPGVGAVPVHNGKQDTPHWGNSFSAQVSQVIYAGGAIRSSIDMAQLGKQMAELDVEKDRQEVRFLLAGYYLDLFKLQNQWEVIEKNIELTQKVITQMKARCEQGTVLKNDITRYELQLQSLELTKSKLQYAGAIINHQICTTLHMPYDTKIMLDNNWLNEELRQLNVITSEQQWQQSATDNNIGIRQATLATELADKKTKNIKAASLPPPCCCGRKSPQWSLY